MTSKRLSDIPGFSIDKVAEKAGTDPDVLRLENLDTDLPPPVAVLEATQQAIWQDDNNSYLPFTGKQDLRRVISQYVSRQTSHFYSENQVVITNGGTEGMFDVLLALTDPGDEVILTDPTYAGMIYRVKLSGAAPVLVPFRHHHQEWRLDLEQLRAAITPRTKALFIMNPSMPSGAVLDSTEWAVITDLCHTHNLWLFYNAAMERILYDKRPFLHPAALPGMQDRTIIIGSASKEFRMIGWRMGWVVAPESVVEAIARTHIYNAVTSSGFAQSALIHAFSAEAEASFVQSVATWEARRNTTTAQLKKYSCIPAAGGWSQLLDVSPLGLQASEAADLLLAKGKVAVTPMTHWGRENSTQYIRLVFSNESQERLSTLEERFRATFG
jgi:aspartate/methionine/tyrosine aminotransferase